MTESIRAMLAYLDGLAQPPSLTELHQGLSRFDLADDDVAEFIRFSDRQYTRNIVRAADHYHAWVLCWKNGQRSPIHDHLGSRCVVRVLRGTLTETLFEFAPNGHVKALFSRDVGPGSLVASEDTDVHQVSNLQAGDADLVTLHVYSPPLVTMGLYSLYERGRGEEVWTPEFTDAGGI
jgi:cysteine dioxygenase